MVCLGNHHDQVRRATPLQAIGELGAYMSGGIKIANSFRQEASVGIVQGSALT